MAARRGVHRDRNQLGARAFPPPAGNHIPANAPLVLHHQKQLPASAVEFCKQFAVVCIAAKTGALDLLDAVEVARPRAPHSVAFLHSVILYFGPFGGSQRPLASKKRRKNRQPIDNNFRLPHTGIKMQLSGNSRLGERFDASLQDLRRGEAAVLDRIDLPGDDARRLMEMGFLPGTTVTAGLSAPGGDPRVFQVDGSEIALRRETARRVKVRMAK